jgi:hypothetical protein
MFNIWTEKSGYNFGTIQESSPIDISLPVGQTTELYDSSLITYTVISGQLPPGLRIKSDRIIGSAFEVPRDSEFRFVIRASHGGEISDRTFFMSVTGADLPNWNTPQGSLPIGTNSAYYILDSSYIDFQLSVIDSDTASGQELKYFIPSGGGELPPGLILTETGRIVGWIQPLLAPPATAGNGRYDNQFFDAYGYDYGLRPNNGYDSYVFDTLFFDYSQDSLPPKKLNRNYEFTVIVTDGDSYTSRQFRIFVVGDDYFRADNTVITAGNGVFTADVTYARAPIWTTPANLGIFRANNYKTFRLDVYEALAVGPIVYNLESVNPDVSGQAFTTLGSENRKDTNKLRIRNVKGTPQLNHLIQLTEFVPESSATIYTINGVQKISDTEYVLTIQGTFEKSISNYTYLTFGTPSILPTNMLFDPSTAEVFGVLPYQTAITKDYNFTVKATRYTEKGETASSKRKFTATIIGEIDSTITWNTNSDLGSIGANYVSTLSVSATTTYAQSPILYYLVGGTLPPGLTLNFDGEIVGKVNQFGSPGKPGLIQFDNDTFTLDEGDTTVDRVYSFTIQAKDVLGFSATSRTFNLLIDTPNDTEFSNLVVRPFLKTTQRNYFKTFITDPEIFDISSIYRPNDPNFGIQRELRMLVYAGIETKSAAEYISAMGRNHSNKRFRLGSVKKAIANAALSDISVYEVVYVEVFDPLEIGKTKLPSIVKTSGNKRKITVDQNNEFYEGPFDSINPYWSRPDPFRVTVDRNDVFAGDPNSKNKFPSSLGIWRDNFKNMNAFKDSNYLPLWMRSIQEGSVQPLGFVKAIPLCYCKPGTADDIILNIKYSNFDFSQIDYTIDRYVIDSVSGYNQDKYLVFRNDRTTIS